MRHEIIPSLRYVDASGAIDFLCNAFGFERQAVYPDEKDPTIIQHAQLLWHDRMIMLGSVPPPAAKPDLPPNAPGLAGLYMIVADVDAHAAHARAAGAEITSEPEDKPYGGRGYGARDPEGNVWSFGSYDPWA
jgi:uncharacterized glyoxalase superfamily protein PhnB